MLQHLTLLDNLANDVALSASCAAALLSWSELAAIRLLRPPAGRGASFLSALQAAAHEAGAPLDGRCRAVLDALEAERFLCALCRWPNTCGVFSSAATLCAYGAQPGGKLRQANLRMLCHRADAWSRATRTACMDLWKPCGAERRRGNRAPA